MKNGIWRERRKGENIQIGIRVRLRFRAHCQYCNIIHKKVLKSICVAGSGGRDVCVL